MNCGPIDTEHCYPLCIVPHRGHGDTLLQLEDGTVALGTLLQRYQALLDIGQAEADNLSLQPMPVLDQLTRRTQMAQICSTASVIVSNVAMGMTALYPIVCGHLEVLPPASVDLALFLNMKTQTAGLTAAVLVMVGTSHRDSLLDHAWHARRTLETSFACAIAT